MNQFLLAAHAQDRAPFGLRAQARWLCCSLLTYRSRVRIVARASLAGLGAGSIFLREPLGQSILIRSIGKKHFNCPARIWTERQNEA
jgi:hypothetical protein